MLDSTPPRLESAVFSDGVALGAHHALRGGPRGVVELGQAFLSAHGGDVAAALGQLLLRLECLERRAGGCRIEEP